MKHYFLILLACMLTLAGARNVHAQFPGEAGFDLNRPIQAPGGNVFAHPWRNEPISYTADKTTVAQIIGDVARQLSVTAEISPGLLGIVSGKLHAASPQAFLDQLAAAHPFDWYVLNGVLHASSYGDRIRSTLTATTRADIGKIIERLGAAGRLLAVGDLPQRQFAVSGPPALVRAFEEELNGQASAQEAAATPAREPSEFFFFPLRHASVQDRVITRRNEKIAIPGAASILRQLVTGMYAPPAGAESQRSTAVAASDVAIVADTRLNALAIRAPKHMLATYRSLIEQLDVEVPLIQLEVTIVDIDSSLEDELGINWSMSSGKSKISVGDPERSGTSKIPPHEIAISTILWDRFAFLARIQALERDGKAEVISRPSILTLNNATALLDLSETFYILNKGERAVETTPVTTGLMVFVTPRVISAAEDDEATAKVAMQIDIEDGKSTAREVAGIPVTKNSTISTQAMVGNRQSLLIAGHHLKETQSETSGVPGLSSIPVLGRLFQSRTESTIDRKRFFLITPRIVSETDAGVN